MRPFESVMLTHSGMVRKNNEDAIGMISGKNVFVLSDGMGGHNAGEIASRYIVDTVIEEIEKSEILESEEAWFSLFIQSVDKANSKVFEHAASHPDTKGMGGTVCILFLNKSRYYLAWAGDSRIYHLTDNKIRLLTEDHSYVWQLYKSGSISQKEMASHPMKNVIFRAVGYTETIETDCKSGDYHEGDIFLLCSDGLNNELSEREIQNILLRSKGIQQAAEKLVNSANENGGGDNISVILVNTGAAI